MINRNIDGGQPFDWGRTSADYAKYRDIYPQRFYDRIIELGLVESEFNVLDVATGTGVLPRMLSATGARIIGTDISAEQIEYAKQIPICTGMNIRFLQGGGEKRIFPDSSFDTATACQCWWYFDHARLSETMYHQLKPKGRLAFLIMNWLPFEDEIVAESERLILKYNPKWSGCNYKRGLIAVPDVYFHRFELVHSEHFDLEVPFAREAWHGRIRASRGVGASLSQELLQGFEREHLEMLCGYPESFNILHSAAIAVLQSKKEQ